MKNGFLPMISGWLFFSLLFFSGNVKAQCLSPTNLGFQATSTTTAELFWTTGGASGWQVEYGVKGFIKGTGTIVSTSSDTLMVTGLFPNVLYEFYVRDSCGTGSFSGWAGPNGFNALPSTCDNFDGYLAGLFSGNSLLIEPWQGNGGDAEISTTYAASASNSLKIYDSGPSSFSDVVAHFGVLTSGVYNLQTDFYVPKGYGGYYNILHDYHTQSTGTNVWAVEVYLDSNGTATVNEGSNGSGVIGTYNFNHGAWNTVEHIIDLDNDTAYIFVNGVSVNVGWRFSLGASSGFQLDAFNFYSAANTGQTPLMYFDNFCLSPAHINDVGLVKFLPPAQLCGDSSYMVQAVVENPAVNAQKNFDIEVEVSGTVNSSFTNTYSGTLGGRTTDTIFLGPLNTFAGGTFDFKAYTRLSSDTANINDTILDKSVVLKTGVSVNLGADTTYCADQSISLTLDAKNPGETFLWNTGQSSQTININSPDAYWVEVTKSNGCKKRDTLHVVANPLPTVNLGSDLSYCADQGIIVYLDAQNSGASYQWSTGQTIKQVKIDSAGVYWVEVTDAAGCAGSDTMEIIEKPSPLVNLGTDTSYCAGEQISLTLDAQNPGATYKWSTGATSQSINVSGAGTYTVSVTNSSSCTEVDQLKVTEVALPVVNLGADKTYCSNVSPNITLNAKNSGSAYLWNTGSISQTITPNIAGTYSVTVTNQYGCEESDEVDVVELPAPDVNLPDVDICEGDTAFLDAGNTGLSFKWSIAGQFNQVLNVTGAGKYSVTVTSTNGCWDSSSAMVKVHQPPVVDLGNDTILAQSSTMTLDAGNTGSTYQWSVTGETNQTMVVTNAGTYSVTVTSPEGCEETDEIVISPVQGIDLLVKGDVKVYPNLVKEFTSIEMNAVEGGEMTIELYNVNGQKVRQSIESVIPGKQIIFLDMESLPVGMYFLKLTMSDMPLHDFKLVKM